ncbi:hypothetical protein BUN20_15785 [Bacteroides fragilis]|nr:hypothetical protein BUN20_15785 [Bacteroides fragilis]
MKYYQRSGNRHKITTIVIRFQFSNFVSLERVFRWGCVKTLFTTDYHRIRILIINNFKVTLCYSVSSVGSFDTPSF